MEFTVKFYPLNKREAEDHQEHDLDVQTDIPAEMDLKVKGWKGPFDNMYKFEVGVVGLGILNYEVFFTYKDHKGALRRGNTRMYPNGTTGTHRGFELVTNIPEASHRHYVLAKFKPLVR